MTGRDDGRPAANRWTRFADPAGDGPTATVGGLREALSGLPDFAEVSVRVMAARPDGLGAVFVARPTRALVTSLPGVYEGVELHAYVGERELESAVGLAPVWRLRAGSPC